MKPLRSNSNLLSQLRTSAFTPIRSEGDLQVEYETANKALIITPEDGQTDFAVNGMYQVYKNEGYEKYRIKVSTTSDFATTEQVVNATAGELIAEVQAALTAGAKYIKVVPVIGGVPDAITGVTISAGIEVDENSTLVLTGSVQGTGDYNTSGTWTRTAGTMTFTTNGNEITISAGAVDDSSTFRFTAGNGTFAERTVTTVAVSDYVPVDSLQGDYDALQALYNSTQGQGVEVLNSTGELPSIANAEYPFMYIISGDIHALEQDDKGNFTNWKNYGAPWPDKTGWDTMTPETMGDALGVETDAGGRVIGLDLWRINLRANGASNPGYYGNNLCGELPEEINNLRLQYAYLKQNFLFGKVPNISNWSACVDICLAGQDQYLKHGDADRSQWHEVSHWSGTPGKKVVTTNRFIDTLPSSIDGFQNLELIEFRHQYMLGPLPEWSDLPSLEAIFIGNARPAGPNSIAGHSIPDSWGGLTNTIFFNIGSLGLTGLFPQSINDNWENLSKISFGGNSFYGPCPEFIKSRDKRYVDLADNEFGKDTNGTLLPDDQRRFPSGYFNGDNSELDKWQIGNNFLIGEISEMVTKDDPAYRYPGDAGYDPLQIQEPNYPQSRDNYRVAAVGLSNQREGNEGFSGPIPEWIQTLTGLQTWFIRDQNFGPGFPVEVAERDRLKTFYVERNPLNVELPDVSWGHRPNPWVYMSGCGLSGMIPNSWISLFAGRDNDIPWDPARNADGTFNYYTFTGTGASLSWDVVTGAVAYELRIINSDDEIVKNETVLTNSFTASGLPSGTYRWWVLGLVWKNFNGTGRYYWNDNDLEGRVPEWIANVNLSRWYLNQNRFTFKDIADSYSAIKASLGASYRIDSQKPFNVPQEQFTANVGDPNVVIDLSEQQTAGNTYQWFKDNNEMVGETANTLTVSTASASNSEYKLQITNSNYPDMGTILSKAITVTIT